MTWQLWIVVVVTGVAFAMALIALIVWDSHA